MADLVKLIIEQPNEIADGYEMLWHEQPGRERESYDKVRAEFNQTHCPALFLYL
ncbi:MAG: hypothetical protein R3C14_12395 [Caldilineaceae bacterium]